MTTVSSEPEVDPEESETTADLDAAAEGDELEEVDAAEIEVPSEPERSFEKMVAASRRLSPERVRSILESLLFVSDKPLSIDQLFDATGIDKDRVRQGLEALQGERREGISGVVLHEVAGGWQLRTDPDSAEYVRRYLKVKPQRLTRAAVESLAIIAYRQPITRPEVEDIRGVDSGAVLKALLERGLIKILGKKEEVGRPMLYGTTKKFLEFFALRDLSSLPTLREFHELSEEHQDIVEREAPPAVLGTVEALRDETFEQKVKERSDASERALAELEQAMTVAEQAAQATAQALATPDDVNTAAPVSGA